MKFILIIVLMASSRTTTVQAEFNNFESCEKARKHIAADVSRTYMSVVSHGCFAKGA